jgi:hypothetical protein
MEYHNFRLIIYGRPHNPSNNPFCCAVYSEISVKIGALRAAAQGPPFKIYLKFIINLYFGLKAKIN